MTEHTQTIGTVIEPGDKAHTGFVDTVLAAPEPLAYSDYHGYDEVGDSYGWRSVVVRAVALVGAAAAVAVGIMAAWSAREPHPLPAAVSPALSSTTPSPSPAAAPATAAEAPTPSTVTVTAMAPDTATVEAETPTPTAVLTPVALPSSSVDRDSLYLRLLRQGQVTTPEGPALAIAGAHAICQELEGGATPNQITAEIVASNPDGVTAAGAAWDVESATLAYCPR